MLQEEVYFEVTLAYKIKMHGRPNFRWPSVLFPRLKGPDIGQTSKGLTELSTTYDQNPPKSQLTAIPFSQNPKLAGCSHFVGCAEDSFFKILVWKRRNKRHQRARESGTKRQCSRRPPLPFSKGKTLSSMSRNCWAIYLAGTRWDSFSRSIDIYWVPTVGLQPF